MAFLQNLVSLPVSLRALRNQGILSILLLGHFLLQLIKDVNKPKLQHVISAISTIYS